MDSLGAEKKCCKGTTSIIFAPTTETIFEPIAPRRSTRLTQTQNNMVTQMSASSTSTGVYFILVYHLVSAICYTCFNSIRTGDKCTYPFIELHIKLV